MPQPQPQFRRLLGHGAIGKFINQPGLGEVAYSIAADPKTHHIVIDFGEPTQFVEMNGPDALFLASTLLAEAYKLDPADLKLKAPTTPVPDKLDPPKAKAPATTTPPVASKPEPEAPKSGKK